LAIVLLVGCGGGKGSSPVTNQGGGRVQMTITWPQRSVANPPSRYVPPYAASIFLELYKQDTPQQRYRLLANRPDDRPSTQTVGFEQLLPVGTYAIAAVARSERNGQGATVAAGTALVDVQSGETANVELVLNSTLRNLEVLNLPLIVKVGATLQAQYRALDPDGKVVLLPPGALVWSLASGSEFGTITPEGLFTGTGDGTARVRVTEQGAGLSAEADVRVADQAFFQVLNQPLIVKAGTTRQMEAAMVNLDGSISSSPGALVWSLASGSEFGTITPDGLFTGTGDGTARVRVTEQGAGLSAEADVAVQAFGTGVNVGVE